MAAKLIPALLLLAPAFAQIPNSTVTNRAVMEITFSAPGTANCGRNNDGSGDAITFSLTSAPQLSACFNLNTTFLNPNVTYLSEGYSCLNDDYSCGANYTLTGWENFNAMANYSQVSYRQPLYSSSNGDDEEQTASLHFQTYSGRDCRQSGVPGPEANETLLPWIRWNCGRATAECSTVEYNVASFAIGPVADYEKEDDCLTAATYGESGAGRTAMSIAALGLALVSMAFTLLWPLAA